MGVNWNEHKKREDDEHRLAVVEVDYRISPHVLGDVLKALPMDAVIIRAEAADYKRIFNILVRSQKFPIQAEGTYPPVIKPVFEWDYSESNGDRRPVFKEMNWPCEVDFPGLKRTS